MFNSELRFFSVLLLSCAWQSAWTAAPSAPPMAPTGHGTSAAHDAQAAHDAPAAQNLRWRLVGPFRGGRTRAVTGVPGSPSTYLVGAVNGGVWRTDDDGRTWQPIFDAEATQSIGAIAVAPSDPKVIYVGSGEGLHRPDLSVGNGIYRSNDSGQTWTHLGLDDAQQIPDLVVDTRDPNRLFVAVLGHPFGPSRERGIYRSTDGGNHWTQVLYIDENTGGSSIKLDPKQPDTLYAALWNARSGPWEDKNEFNGTAGGLFKSTDGGDHWHPLKQGLPENLTQIEVAVAPSVPTRLYATVATTVEGDYSSAAGLGVYRSDDGGEHWQRATNDPRPALRIGGGDLPIIKVDPTNADILYSASIVTTKSIDGGAHWTSLRGAPGGDDYQNLWISPDNPRHIALVGDQGAIISVNGGSTWSSWFNQPTAQLYHIGITPTFPYRICAGQQESGSVCIASRGNDGQITAHDWHSVGVIEYGYVLPDPLDADVIYGAGRNVVTKTHLSTGQVQDISPIPLRGDGLRVDRTEPILFSPQDAHRLYYAANRLYASSDAGQSWTTISPDLSREQPGAPPSVGALKLPKADQQRGAIYAVSASPVKSGLLWAGTDDGLIWVTSSEGQEWRNVTPAVLEPWSKVTQLEASHFDAGVAYASVSRLRVDDLKPYLYRTRDGGQSWQDIGHGLPVDAPANTLREDPTRRGLLFAGTEKAVWVSYDDGDHWQSLQLNLPHTSMRDIAIHDNDLIVATHGRSFWILDDISPLRQTHEGAAAEAALLIPAVAIRVMRSTNTDTPIPPDEPTGRNPPDGAVIDYSLSHAITQTVSIEILDGSGKLVRRVSSQDPAPYSAQELADELIPSYWLRQTPSLATTAGMHRWVWDLHYPSPRTPARGFPIAAVPGDTPQVPQGPVAIPGQYRVRLQIGAHHWEQPLVVKPDPRVTASAEDYAQQFDLARVLASALDASTGALFQTRSLRAQLKEMHLPAGGALAMQSKSLDQQLAQLLDPDSTPLNSVQAATPSATPVAPIAGLEHTNGDLATLYATLGADAAPTTAQSAAARAAVAAWQPIQARWDQLRTHGIVELNSELRRSHLPELKPEQSPPHDPDQADEE